MHFGIFFTDLGKKEGDQENGKKKLQMPTSSGLHEQPWPSG